LKIKIVIGVKILIIKDLAERVGFGASPRVENT